jgi:hypothetical protein
MKPIFLAIPIKANNSVNPRFHLSVHRIQFALMPTKKQASRREHTIADKKNHPVSKSNRPAISQNAEPQPPRRKDQNAL